MSRSSPESRPSAAGAARTHLVAASWAVAIGALLLAPAAALPGSEDVGLPASLPVDKVVHFLLYLVAAPSWRRSAAALGGSRPGLLAFVFACVDAAFIELAQGALGWGRSPELLDFAAGAAGALAGLGLAIVVRPPRPWARG